MEEQEIGVPAASLAGIKHIILILSGKGGVGKSSVTTQTALTLCSMGFKVGVLDIDLTGPSLPRMFGLENESIYQGPEGWQPVKVETNSTGSLSVISLGFLLGDRGNSVIWRGPKKTSMIKQFISDVAWEELRYSKPDGGIVVTTPQSVATADVKKEINFCKKVDLKILGIIENMSGFVCPHCAECTNIFSSGGGKRLSEQFSVPYLGNVPIDPKFVEMIENQNTSLVVNNMTRDTPEDVSTAGAKDILDVLNLLKGGEEKISEVELKLDEMEKKMDSLLVQLEDLHRDNNDLAKSSSQK
ncbi:BEM_collapsed_G0028420.mRNA.1.CDS.1 [Saccharomyces cerevisiae]|nr:BEM_collapsed_G0028420.mRNA.1.CDS.1 [Saccharomyces cerevisiae]